tara:strand:- start:1593 stop:1781 length:189 start_codon:yes stop_codon:yes gene_type:complete
MKDIKVIFRGYKVPSGKPLNVPVMIGKARLEAYKNDGRYDMEILDQPKPKKKKAPKKEASDG